MCCRLLSPSRVLPRLIPPGLMVQKLEYVARTVRGSTAPFGGIHLVLCGDFLQLPPVVARSDKPGTWRRPARSAGNTLTTAVRVECYCGNCHCGVLVGAERAAGQLMLV